MKTRPTLALAFTTLLFAGASSGCGAESDPAVAGDDTAEDSASLFVAREVWVTLRPDLRRCIAPLCGGYFVKMVNRTYEERYASRLDIHPDLLGEDDQMLDRVLATPPRALLLRGYLGRPDPRFHTQAFVVTGAHRALPGVDVARGEAFYAVESAAPPFVPPRAVANHFTATWLNSAVTAPIHAVDIEHAALPFVDQEWLTDRVANHGAIALGHVTHDKDPAGMPEARLDVEQVYLRLPERVGPCPRLHPVCPWPEVPAYTRNADRCLVFDGCIDPTECRDREPLACPDGYTRVTWPVRGKSCTDFACDPAFCAP